MKQEIRYDYLEKLIKERSSIADALEKPSVSGVKDSVVDKYSDQAHFIYELLQNADDAGATTVRFVLEENRLLFFHNGTRHFTVSNPDTEAEDRKKGLLGDLNAITSIGQSSKSGNNAKIGKFGVGFKAVFQYTETPVVYSPNVSFRIERMIVPNIVHDDIDDREKDETCFVFPFNKTEISAKEAYQDISKKLRSLNMPMIFLNSLVRIAFSDLSAQGEYVEDIEDTCEYAGGIKLKKVCYTKHSYTKSLGSDENVSQKNRMLLFSRATSENYVISIVYFLNDNDELIPKKYNVFCFFPTKVYTGLSFAIHAPFLLTDSREGIKAGKQHNIDMIDALAELASDTLLCIKELGKKTDRDYLEDKLFEIIPYESGIFMDSESKGELSFLPFYEKIKRKLKTEAILPTGDNNYIEGKHAYWSTRVGISKWFNNDTLRELVGDEKACWVFDNIGGNAYKGYSSSVVDYIKSIVEETLLDEDILQRITASFIEKRSLDWLLQLYRFLSRSEGLMSLAKTLPIILDREMRAVSAYSKNGMTNIFMPTDDEEDERYRYVSSKILKEEDGLNFLNALGVHEPDIKDDLYRYILPLYEKGAVTDSSKHWKYFLKFYKKYSTSEVRKFIKKLKECAFMFYKDENNEVHSVYPNEVYIKNKEIEEYFKGTKKVKFYNYNDLREIAIKSNTEDVLDEFLHEFGLDSTLPRIVDYNYSFEEAKEKKLPYSNTPSARKYPDSYRWKEKRIDGLEENIRAIEKSCDIPRAKFLWKYLLRTFNKYFIARDYETVLTGEALRIDSFFNRANSKPFVSSEVDFIRNNKWLINYKGEFVSPSEVTVQELDRSYRVDGGNTGQFYKFLGIEEESTENLSNRQKEKISFYNELEKTIGKDKLEKLLEDEKRKKLDELNRKKQKEENEQKTGKDKEVDSKPNSIDDLTLNDDKSDIAANDTSISNDDLLQVVKDVGLRVQKRIQNKSKDYAKEQTTVNQQSDISFSYVHNNEDLDEVNINVPDEDEFTRASVDYKKKIEDAKERTAKEIEEIQEMEVLEERARKAEKYSYEWFLALLDLELEEGKNGTDSREVSLKFGKIVKEEGTERTVILSNPDRYIPMFMEELSNIELKMVAHDGSSHKAIIEAMSVKDYTLKVKLRSSDEINNLDLNAIRECNIKAVSPSFLLEALVEEFKKLQLSPDDNLQNKLTKDIKFVFGPPGTGKTTYLARNIIKQFMEEERIRVLILTPTNKAADVIARRIMDVYGDNKSWKDWLIRFGTTNDEVLEKEGVYKEKTIDLGKLSRCVIITTISRYPYDFFMPGVGKRLPLHDVEWDHIVVDEASMIPLANITYLLYNAQPENFIIAGDPFQIEPITSVDIWKNENIYEMVQLKSFTNPHTVPYDYEIENLTTQYRSIPSIGNIFSRFAYDGVLKHNRTEESCRKLNIDDVLPLKNLSIVKFPVSKYEGIYRAKRLTRSPYQVYIGLFVVEFTKYLSNQLARCNPNERFSIGVIAPYRAEASLIDKLLVQMDLPTSVEVQAGTIHGFQGDECDIILCVFNPPPYISNNSQMFLNKKNIINVAISRAKDYLIMIMPDNKTANISNLFQVLTVEKLIKEEGEKRISSFGTKELEKLMFGTEDYIESNTFNTNHQSVNVYGLPEYYYEVRSEENALDVQIHKEAIKIRDGSEQIDSEIEVNDIRTDGESLSAIDVDIYHDVDEDGWDCHEIAQLIALYENVNDNNANAQVLAEQLQNKMAIKYKGRADEVEKMNRRDIMTIGYKLMVIKELAKDKDARSAGASELEYKMWKMYNTERERYIKVLNLQD